MENVALPHDGLRPAAWQSSLPYASLGWGFPLAAGLAIDNGRTAFGNVMTSFFAAPSAGAAYVPAAPPNAQRSCQHSAPNDANPWWGVDLGAATDIDAIRLFQRTDCCRGRFSGFVIYTSQTNASARAAGALPWADDGVRFPVAYADLMETSVRFRAAQKTLARYIFVNLPGSGAPMPNRYLTICEAQVFRKRRFVVRDLSADANVALGAETFAPNTMTAVASGARLPSNAVDGIVDVGANAESFVSVAGPTGAAAAANAALAPFVGVDLGAVFDLGSGPSGRTVTIMPSRGMEGISAAAGNTRISVYTGLTRDYNYMKRCWGPGLLAPAAGVAGSGGYINLPSACAGEQRIAASHGLRAERGRWRRW